MDLATLEPTPADSQLPPRRPAYDSTLDHAPFETLEKYYPCPPACISRNLMTEDVEGAQVYTGIRDPLDPMCLNKPYPEIWLVGSINKNQKPSRSLQTNRHTNPLDPMYTLPSGPSLIPCGEKVRTPLLPSLLMLLMDNSVGIAYGRFFFFFNLAAQM
jgi:hypothetical protein